MQRGLGLVMAADAESGNLPLHTSVARGCLLACLAPHLEEVRSMDTRTVCEQRRGWLGLRELTPALPTMEEQPALPDTAKMASVWVARIGWSSKWTAM